MDSSIDENLLEKLVKLQERIVDRGFTQAEAEQAAEKVQELLTKNNLSMLDLDKFQAGMAGSIKEQMFMMSARSNWRRELLNQISRHNHCRMIFFKGTKYVQVVGHQHNIDVSIQMYEWLESIFDGIVDRERDMLRNRRWPTKVQRDAHGYMDFDAYTNIERSIEMYEKSRSLLIRNRQTWSNSFRFGMVVGIAAAMKKANNNVRQEVGESKWALIPVMDAEVDDYVQKKDIPLDKRKISIYTAAKNHGYKVGESVNMSHQINPGSGHLALGE